MGPSVLPVLEEAMVAHEAAVVLHAREQGVRGQHASSVRAFSECRPCALMRVFHDDDCLGVFLVCFWILVGRQSVTLKAKLLDVVCRTLSDISRAGKGVFWRVGHSIHPSSRGGFGGVRTLSGCNVHKILASSLRDEEVPLSDL